MADITPTQIFAGYELVAAGSAVTNESIVIPLTSLAGLTNTEADSSTGDGREVLRILLESAFNRLNSLDAASRPNKVIFSKAQNLPAAVGVNEIRQTYTYAFDVSFNPGDVSLVAE